MRFIYFFPGRWVPLNPELLTLDAHVRLTRAAEAAGFAGVAVDEHPIPSETWRNGPGGHDCLDPFIALATVGAIAPQMKLLTYLAVVPYRNPFLLAKQAATLDVISGGRLLFGVGTGYQEPEFKALGVDFAVRNALFDEGLEAMKLAWSGEVVNYRGRHFHAEDVRAVPVPVSRPHPPIWIGGNSNLTMRRVVDSAQGWMPMPNPRSKADLGRAAVLETIEDLAELKRYLDAYAEKQGRTEPIDICCSLVLAPKEPAALIDHLGELAELGVTWVSVNGEGSNVAEGEEWCARFGEEVLRPFTAGR